MLFQVVFAADDGLAPVSLGLGSITTFEGQVGQVAKGMADRLAAVGPVALQVLIHLQRPPILRVGFAAVLSGWIDRPRKCQSLVRRHEFLSNRRRTWIAGHDGL